MGKLVAPQTGYRKKPSFNTLLVSCKPGRGLSRASAIYTWALAANDVNPTKNSKIPTLDRTIDIYCLTPFDLTIRQISGDVEERMGTRARNLEPRLPVVDQTGEYKRVSGTYAKT